MLNVRAQCISKDSLKASGFHKHDDQINSRFRNKSEATRRSNERIWCFQRVTITGNDVLKTFTARLHRDCFPLTFIRLYFHLSPSSIPHHEFLKPIWERCRLGSLFGCPSTVSSPSHHLLIALQSAAGLPTGQFRWSAVSFPTAAHPRYLWRTRGQSLWPLFLPPPQHSTVDPKTGSLTYATRCVVLTTRYGSNNRFKPWREGFCPIRGWIQPASA